MHKYQKLVPVPHPDSMNSGCSPLHQSLMLATFGVPGDIEKAKDCTEITSKRLLEKIVTQNVGPFKVTGHITAVESLKRVFAKVKLQDPELYALIGTAGMTCCRLVRGSDTQWSNHSFGFAIDITVGGDLIELGAKKISVGLLRLYPYFHSEGFFWGAEFRRPDAMHFEVSTEKFLEWRNKKLI